MSEFIQNFSFGQPWWLLLLLVLPAAGWLRGQLGKVPGLRYSSVNLLREVAGPIMRSPGKILLYLWLAALFLSIVALARPRLDLGSSPDQKEGVDIVFCVDVSGSMDQKTFPYKGTKISNREALIHAIGDFVDNRPSDRFGMIGFAEHTYLMSPLTIDGDWIKSVLKEIKLKSWTAIGEGIVSSVDLLKQSKSPSKIIVVASDGGNNKGISPYEAAQMARKERIRVYTVQFMPPGSVSAANSDSLMSKVATTTGGLYFQASSFERIMSIYREIDRMEKTKFKQKQFRLYEELYSWFVLGAGVTIILSWVGGNTVWLRVP
ncbi:MAG: VWA domain-containing protein [Candidatus Methylacidiphilales bacterium]